MTPLMANFKRAIFQGTGRGRRTREEKLNAAEIKKYLTKDQLQLRDDIKKGQDDPIFFAESILDLRLHPLQKIWLWMTTKTQFEKACVIGVEMKVWKDEDAFRKLVANVDFQKNILVPSNRWGKTLVTSIKHIWINFYKKGCKGSPEQIRSIRAGTLNLSPHSNQCQAAFDYILDILAGKFVYEWEGKMKTNNCRIKDFYLSHNDQRRMILFKNETFFKTVPTGEDQASSLAGMRFLYISYDEAPQSLHLKEELPAKIMSRLIDFGGPLDLIGTPEVDKPSHQYFHHITKQGLKGEDGWFTLIGKMADNIFLNEKEMKKVTEAIRSTDPAKYRQVVFGEFVTTGKKMFDGILVERLWDRKEPEIALVDHQYLVSTDWGFADTGDPTVFYVIDYTAHPRYRVVYREAIHGGSPFIVLTRARVLQREWNGARFIHDTASMGGTIIKKMLQEMNMTGMLDFSYAGGQKADMLFSLVVTMSDGRKTSLGADGKVIEENPNFGRLRSYYIADLEEQLGNYQYNPEKGVTDKRIEQNDVMSLGMGIWWLERKYRRNEVKSMNFNPLAPTIEQVIPMAEAKKIGMRVINIPEKRIL